MSKYPLITLVALIAIAAVLSYNPAMHEARAIIPPELYVGQDCDCTCIMAARPWYARTNYWFWVFLLYAPLVVFSVGPNQSHWRRGGRHFFGIVLGYVLINLMLHLSWDIRNDAFYVQSDYPDQPSWDMNCADVADGASIVFYAMLGWVFAAMYQGWWEVIWKYYHLRRTKQLTLGFTRDWFSCIVVCFSTIVTWLLLLWIGSIAVAHFAPDYFSSIVDYIAPSYFVSVP